MTENKSQRFTVIENKNIENKTTVTNTQLEKNPPANNYHTNVMYQKLLNFRNLQEQQKKKFSVDDLFKLC